jgi:ankyrin repeat protein
MFLTKLATPFLLLTLLGSNPKPDDRLSQAVQRGDRPAVESLLRSHVPVDSAEGDGTTALHWAAYQNNIALAQLLLDAHANVNVKTRIDAATPLFMACQNGSAPMIELLLRHGANVNTPNALGTTPLMIAASSGNADAVKVLLTHGADPNARESAHQQTALMFAANLDRGDAIRVLVDHGADPNIQSKLSTIDKPARNFGPINGNGADPVADVSAPPTTPAAPRRQRPQQETRPQQDTASSDDKASATTPAPAAPMGGRDRGPTTLGGFAPLHYAARQGSLAATIALLDKGADINEVTLSEQSTPLVLAIANGHLDVAKVLVDRGADVNKANIMDVTPLYATIDVAWVPKEWSPEPVIAQEKTNYLVLMQDILDHHADPNARLGRAIWSRVLAENRVWTEVAGSTAFLRAAMADDVKAMKLLVAAGADPNIPTKTGTTPLMVAAGVGWGANYSQTAPDRMAAVQYCISQGGKITAQDDLGFTALHGAGFVGDLPIIQYLVDHGARPDVKSKAGDTPADSANGPFEKSLPQPQAVALLVKLGAPEPTNCRSSDCIPATKEDRVGGAGRRRQQAPMPDDPKPAAGPVKIVEPAKPAITVTTTPHDEL